MNLRYVGLEISTEMKFFYFKNTPLYTVLFLISRDGLWPNMHPISTHKFSVTETEVP